MYCGKCGTFNENTNKFCVTCGEQFLNKTEIKISPGASVSHSSSGPQTISLKIGQLLANRYELRQVLGHGGMGEVYKAYDMILERVVAIKIVSPALLQNEEILKRFNNEAKVAKQMLHENIAKAIATGEDNGIHYLVMEYVEGTSLREWINTKAATADVEEILDIIIQTCKGLEHAHLYTVHRDIKPENIMLTKENVVKITDFGIAKMISLRNVTSGTSALGTAYYMAPEQTNDAGIVDERADLFSVGIILYEMLTGRVPIGNFHIPTSTKRLVSKGITEIIKKALESDPKERFKNAREMLDALQKEYDTIRRIKLEKKVFKIEEKEAEVLANKNVVNMNKPSRPKISSYVVPLITIIIMLLVVGGGIWFYIVFSKETRRQEVLEENAAKTTAVNFKTFTDLVNSTEKVDPKTNLPYQVSSKVAGVEMCLIPEGEFVMGSKQGEGDDDEVPVHKVWVDNVYMGKYEITNKQYKMFIDDTGYEPPVNVFGQKSEYTVWDGSNVSYEILDYPVINVSWYDANEFLNWLCKKEGVPDGVYRLPSEAEWEKAAKGSRGEVYPWGNTEPNANLLNFQKRWMGPFTLKKVGFYESNGFGLYDMAGNVWEWCLDKYDSEFYKKSPYKNPVNTKNGVQYVLRGGSWSSYAFLVRSANRYSNEPDVRYFYNGFRVARSIKT